MPDKPIAFITGASRGIGQATALEFASRGYNLALTAFEPPDLAQVAANAQEKGARVFSLPGDLHDLSFAQSFINSASAALGPPHVLVNNAAWRETVTMREISPESWEKTLRICLTAPAFLARWAAELMEPLRRGAIINISSLMSGHATGIAPAYVAAKGALDSLTYDLAALYGPAGIRVLALNPGAVDTNISADLVEDQKISRDIRQWSQEMISLRRWATPREIARTVAWLASDDASYLTGTTIAIDGGWSHQLYPHSLKVAMRPNQFR